jgi:hypothetical protein
MANTDERVTVSFGKALCTVLVWGVGFGYAQRCKVDGGCFHTLESTGGSGEA